MSNRRCCWRWWFCGRHFGISFSFVGIVIVIPKYMFCSIFVLLRFWYEIKRLITNSQLNKSCTVCGVKESKRGCRVLMSYNFPLGSIYNHNFPFISYTLLDRSLKFYTKRSLVSQASSNSTPNRIYKLWFDRRSWSSLTGYRPLIRRMNYKSLQFLQQFISYLNDSILLIIINPQLFESSYKATCL